MATKPELAAAVKAILDAWPDVIVQRENEPEPSAKEYVRLTTLEGESSIPISTGLLGAARRGSVERHPVTLVFDIFTEANTGTARSDELTRLIAEKFRATQILPSVQMLYTSNYTFGVDKPHYHTQTQIAGFRDEQIL